MRKIGLILALGAAALVLPAPASAQNAQLVAEGAQIYGSHCMRCHNLRSPAEFTDLSWRTIIAQMRARANLTRAQARAVLAFVQATNGTDGPGSPTSPPGDADASTSSPVSPTAAKPAPADGGGLSPAQRAALRAYVARLRTGDDHGG